MSPKVDIRISRRGESSARSQFEARYYEPRQEVEGLRELRQIAGKAQEDVATALNIKQPSVSKIENQADMYLSTIRSYVEAIGVKLGQTVKLPARPPVRIEHLGDYQVGELILGGGLLDARDDHSDC